jgi:hypothetical protein
VSGAQDAAVNPYTGQAQFAEGGDVGGYTYDPVTQMYTKKAGEGATMVSPVGGISGASGESGSSGGNTPSMNPQTLAFLENETPAERDTRMGIINDLATRASKMGITGMLMSAYESAFGGPSAAQQANNSGLNAMSGRQEAQMNAGPDFGGVAQSGHSSSFDGTTVSETGNTPGGGGAESEARGGLNLNGKYYPPKYAQGGISNLGDYSDGGRLLRGPGDGISDSIPAMIGKKQPARLADGEFVIPARIVSELGNGSTEAGARKLYAMMDRVQKARKKTVGKGKVAANSRSAKYLPA